MMKAWMSSFLVICTACVVLSLTGCAGTLGLRPVKLTDDMIAQKGIVFGSMNVIDGLMDYSSYYFHLRSVDSGEVVPIRVWLSDVMAHKADANDNGILRYVAATDVAPGEYEYFKLSAFATNGYVSETVTFTLKQPERFRVEAGHAYYLGAAAPIPKIGENFLGVDEIKGIRFLLLGNEAADVKLARYIFPNLPEVTALKISKSAKFNSDGIQRIALVVNPEEKFWDEAAYQRVVAIKARSEEDASVSVEE